MKQPSKKAKKLKKCPICAKEMQWEGNEYRPFCSKRCRDIDLTNWVDETYSIPGRPFGEEEETA